MGSYGADSAARSSALPADLRTLMERVEAQTGPDRGLNDDVLFATGHRYSLSFLSSTGWRWKGVDLREREVPITASIDAALALVERVLPGARVGMTWEPDSYARAELLINRNRSTRLLGDIERVDGHLALAIIAALLRALFADQSAGNASDAAPERTNTPGSAS